MKEVAISSWTRGRWLCFQVSGADLHVVDLQVGSRNLAGTGVSAHVDELTPP